MGRRPRSLEAQEFAGCALEGMKEGLRRAFAAGRKSAMDAIRTIADDPRIEGLTARDFLLLWADIIELGDLIVNDTEGSA